MRSRRKVANSDLGWVWVVRLLRRVVLALDKKIAAQSKKVRMQGYRVDGLEVSMRELEDRVKVIEDGAPPGGQIPARAAFTVGVPVAE